MPRLESDEPEAPLRKCDRCAKPCDEEFEVWTRIVCARCFDAWVTDAPNAGQAAKLATAAQLAESREAESGQRVGGMYRVFYMAWTAEWIARGVSP